MKYSERAQARTMQIISDIVRAENWRDYAWHVQR